MRRAATAGRVIAGCLLACTLAAAAKIGGPTPSGGVLRLVIRAEPKTLDPHIVVDEASETVQYLTAGVLIRQNRLTQQLEPALAESWKVLDGRRAIEFHLRTEIAFSDGTPFTAEDVAYTMRRIADPALHSPYAETLKSQPGGITAVVRSPSVVIVRVPGPVANLPELFDQISIVSSKSPKKYAATLGPFEISEYKAGAYLMLERNPRYWKRDAIGRQLPYLDGVRIDIQSNRETELLRFRRGELHLLNGLDPESFDRLAAEMPGAVRDLGPAMDSEQLWFNQVKASPIPAYKREWFENTAFRQAISGAINRADLCRLVYRGHAIAAAGPVSPANRAWVNTRLKPAVYSPSASLALLSRSGFHLRNGVLLDRAGRPVEFSVITNAGSKSRERMAALIQQDLAKIGIRLNVVPMDLPSLIERISRTFEYEACLLGQNLDIDPNGVLNVWRSSAPNHQWNPNQKSPQTAWEAEIDRLMDQQAAASSPAKRKAAFDRVQEIAAEQQPFIFLVHKNALVGISPNVLNTKPAVLRPQTFWNVDTLAVIAPSSR